MAEVAIPLPPTLRVPTMPDVQIDVNNLMHIHAANGAQITADGRSALAEFTRLHHLRASDLISFKEAAGVRHVTEAGQTSTQSNANAK